MQNPSQPLRNDACLSFHAVPSQHCPFGKAAPNMWINESPLSFFTGRHLYLQREHHSAPAPFWYIILIWLSKIIMYDYNLVDTDFSTSYSKLSMPKRVCFDPQIAPGICESQYVKSLAKFLEHMNCCYHHKYVHCSRKYLWVTHKNQSHHFN